MPCFVVVERERRDARRRAAGIGVGGHLPRRAAVVRAKDARLRAAARRRTRRGGRGRSTRHWPLAAKPASPGCAGGIPACETSCQLIPPSFVEMIRNLPLTGSDSASPRSLVEERHAVVERGRLGVRERLRPVRAAVRRDVDPEVSRVVADRQDHGVLRVERLDVAELQRRSCWAARRICHVLPLSVVRSTTPSVAV